MTDEELICKYVPLEKQEECLKKLQSNYPVQYLIGNVDFCGSIIDVSEDVLIPRFETEYLVENLLFYLRRYEYENPRIIDIGTGSGCISIALKKSINCEVDALDISSKALKVARHNAEKNNTEINFICTDIAKFKPHNKYHVLVSNPPYVPLNSIVDPKTKYEPQKAIFAKDNGLYFYNLILDKAHELLFDHNIIAFEIGENQSLPIQKKALSIYPHAKIIIRKDLNNIKRYLFIINE